ncbi:hypothetical protein XSR1_10281 [Xenorhabdus szentirmaii DSM 16338]|uniref:Uncharacterized protein n=1 Tax=Xenorhabdus szentirmaii DSM 16338 TaxID=1427518 RepID=W1ISM4_9GAMM|nr:hypothetical protein XSR1_10281 [Xenorhabdus szentirmaii DSM 16338]
MDKNNLKLALIETIIILNIRIIIVQDLYGKINLLSTLLYLSSTTADYS